MTAMSAEKPYLNRDRRALMGAIDRGKVRVSDGGVVVWRRTGRANANVGRKVRELADAGWIALGDDERTYRLTGLGRADLDAAGRGAGVAR